MTSAVRESPDQSMEPEVDMPEFPVSKSAAAKSNRDAAARPAPRMASPTGSSHAEDDMLSKSWVLRLDAPHGVENQVRHALESRPDIKIQSLVVRRIPRGVCLQGTVVENDQGVDICGLVRAIDGVTEVLNHLVEYQSESKPTAPR